MLPQCTLFYSVVDMCLQTIPVTNHFILEVNFFVIQLDLSSIYSRVDKKKKLSVSLFLTLHTICVIIKIRH